MVSNALVLMPGFDYLFQDNRSKAIDPRQRIQDIRSETIHRQKIVMFQMSKLSGIVRHCEKEFLSFYTLHAKLNGISVLLNI